MPEEKPQIIPKSIGPYACYVFDLENEEEAMMLGQHLAETTGHEVTVRNTDGIPLATFEGALQH